MIILDSPEDGIILLKWVLSNYNNFVKWWTVDTLVWICLMFKFECKGKNSFALGPAHLLIEYDMKESS